MACPGGCLGCSSTPLPSSLHIITAVRCFATSATILPSYRFRIRNFCKSKMQSISSVLPIYSLAKQTAPNSVLRGDRAQSCMLVRGHGKKFECTIACFFPNISTHLAEFLDTSQQIKHTSDGMHSQASRRAKCFSSRISRKTFNK